MKMQDIEQKPPKITDVAMSIPPKKLRSDTELLATFTLLMWPLCAKNLRLVRQGGEIKLWTMTPELRFLGSAKPIIIEAAMEQVRSALDSMDILDG